MKCPHCNKAVKALVVETRQHEDAVYRRRSCGSCGASYITVESSPAGLKMPEAVRNGKARGHLPAPQRVGGKLTGGAAHLQNVWR